MSINRDKLKSGARIGTMAGMLGIATLLVSAQEGVTFKPYKDLAGVLTICYGETEGVKPNQIENKQSCDAMLSLKLKMIGLRVDSMIEPAMTNERWAALTSFSYNVGLQAFKNSTLLKRLNKGDPKACDEIMRWTYIGKKDCSIKKNLCYGIYKRREIEHRYCKVEI